MFGLYDWFCLGGGGGSIAEADERDRKEPLVGRLRDVFQLEPLVR